MFLSLDLSQSMYWSRRFCRGSSCSSVDNRRVWRTILFSMRGRVSEGSVVVAREGWEVERVCSGGSVDILVMRLGSWGCLGRVRMSVVCRGRSLDVAVGEGGGDDGKCELVGLVDAVRWRSGRCGRTCGSIEERCWREVGRRPVRVLSSWTFVNHRGSTSTPRLPRDGDGPCSPHLLADKPTNLIFTVDS